MQALPGGRRQRPHQHCALANNPGTDLNAPARADFPGVDPIAAILLASGRAIRFVVTMPVVSVRVMAKNSAARQRRNTARSPADAAPPG